jgi:Divergent InlB B-repeat domain/Right handed beta helix region
MKLRFVILSIGLLLASMGYLQATDYYFSSINGNDDNDGLSAGSPKLSESAMQTVLNSLNPGDNIFLECGSVWYDVDLYMENQHGSADQRISISSYGTGELPQLISMKKLGTFTYEGEHIWSITDEDLPLKLRNQYQHLQGGYYGYYNDLNFLIIDGQHYAMAKEPNGDTYFSFEDVDPNYRSYGIDMQATYEKGFWKGAHMKVGTRDWIVDDVRINDFEDGKYSINSGDWGWDGGGEMLHNHNGNWLFIKFVMANHRNAMNLDGEWCYDNYLNNLAVYWEKDLNESDIYQSYNDYALSMLECSKIDISKIEFRGSVMNTVKIAGSDEISLSECKIRYSPRIALMVDKCTNVLVKDNFIRDGTSIGIFNSHGRANTIEGNTVINMGCYASMGGDRDGDNKIGIKDDRRLGTTIIRGNRIDSTGYSAINITGNYSTTPPPPAHLIVENNDISNFCLIASDGAAIYVWEDEFTPENTIQRVSGNIISHGGMNVGYLASQTSLTSGVYFDGLCTGMNGIGNTLYNLPLALYSNGTVQSTFRDNKIYNVGNVHCSKHGFIGKSSGFGHNGEPDKELTIVNNQIVLRDPESVCGNWLYSVFAANEALVDSNYYYQPFTSDGLVMKKTVNWSPTRITLDDWRNITDFDAHSSLNKNGEQFSSSLGIESDQFVKFLLNRDQEMDRVVKLYDCVFEDVDGNELTDSIVIAPRTSEFLFYKSGSPDSLALIVPDPLHQADTVAPLPTLYITRIGNGTVDPFHGAFNRDSVLNMTAVPDPGWSFKGWSGDISGSSSETMLTMNGDKNVVATFIQDNTISQDTVAKLNFSYDASWSVDGWTSVFGSSSFPVSLVNGTVVSSSGGNLATGTSGEPESTLVPGKVSSTYNWMSNEDDTPIDLAITGLDPDKWYDFLIYASRDDSAATGTRTTTFTIKGTTFSGSVNALGNTNQMVKLMNIGPDPTGLVTITMTKQAGEYGYINAMIITRNTSVGTSDKPDADAIVYYPVPVGDFLFISNISRARMIEVFDQVGRKVMHRMCYGEEQLRMELQDFIPGIYLFRITNEDASIKTFKISKI